jgi:hypothetical protein
LPAQPQGQPNRSWRFRGLRPPLAAEECGDRGKGDEQEEQASLHVEPSFAYWPPDATDYEQDRVGR